MISQKRNLQKSNQQYSLVISQGKIPNIQLVMGVFTSLRQKMNKLIETVID